MSHFGMQLSKGVNSTHDLPWTRVFPRNETLCMYWKALRQRSNSGELLWLNNNDCSLPQSGFPNQSCIFVGNVI